jgi:beta-glucanase (GH16 family)
MKMTTIFLCFWIFVFSNGCKNEDSPSSTSEKENITDQDSVPQLPGWKLVWNDEFNDSRVDLTKWEYEVNGDGGGNNELQYYTARDTNSYTRDGVLVIQALKEIYQNRQYTSARMRTRNKGDWKYGRFEIRAKLPYSPGIWPAIWMLPTDWEYGGWPKSGEIDIMECLGHDPWKIYGTIHFGSSVSAHQQMGGNYTRSTSSPSFAADFHVFVIEWDSTSVQWYVDSIKYYTAYKSSPFDKRFHLLLNVAVGGNWPGNPNDYTIFPQKMSVDYVRVYQRP